MLQLLDALWSLLNLFAPLAQGIRWLLSPAHRARVRTQWAQYSALQRVGEAGLLLCYWVVVAAVIGMIAFHLLAAPTRP
jgi:hypothetical protein